MTFRLWFACAQALLACHAAGQQGQQWPAQLLDPNWQPHIGYMRQSTGLVGQGVIGPKLTWKGPGASSVTWTLVDPPQGAYIDRDNRIEWPNPTDGTHAIKVRAEQNGSTEEATWLLNVIKPTISNSVVFSTKHIDYIVPDWYAQWLQKVQASNVIDGYYEFARDLLGLPCDMRQSILVDPAIGGAHSGIPIVCGLLPLGTTDAEHWRLGFLFHELGHNLNSNIRVDYLEGGDHQVDIWIHGMVEFDKIAWVKRMLDAPDKQGTPDVQNFADWMKAESHEFVPKFLQYLKQVPNGAQLETWTDAPSEVWAGWVHQYAFRFGEEAVERVLLCMRRDGLALADYPAKGSSADRLTILMCVMSGAAGRDLLPEYQAMNFPVNEPLYRQFYGTVQRVMAHLPAIGVNGAKKCPVDGHYYALTPYHMTWPEAEATARRLGGHLATIRSKEQEQWLATLFGRSGWIWVGYKRESPNGPWSWISGEHTEPPLWEPNRPESDPNRYFGVLILHEDGSKPENGWFGLANRPYDESQIGIMEFDHPPTTDTDSMN